MNAALIAACTVSKRNQEQAKFTYPKMYLTKDFDVYYVVIFRKYYHFEPTTLIKPIVDRLPIFNDEPIQPSPVSVIKVEPKSFALQHSFSISPYKDEVKQFSNIDRYIECYKHRFTESNVWCTSDLEVEKLYKDFIKNTYGIDLTMRLKDLNYTTQFCWEVVCDVCDNPNKYRFEFE